MGTKTFPRKRRSWTTKTLAKSATPPPPYPPMSDLSASERLSAALADRYTIERELGEGGMATVYLAQDIKHERKVAIKVLKPELAAMIGGERFVAEIRTTAALQHPHILPLFDSGAADGFLYYVMPYIEGETLRGRLDRERQIGVDEALRIARDVADALDYAHRSGVIHRDIKPENILLHDGRPVVADFGIAVAISAAGGGRMTETGLSLGTPHYMSPEQATADRDLSARSDIYSLACVLYEMLAGDPPHTGPTAQAILMRILTESPRTVTQVRSSVPPHVSAVISKALEKLPADRFESAKEFADALENESFRYAVRKRAVEDPEPVAAPVARPTTLWRSALPWGVAAAMTIVAVAAVIGSRAGGGAPDGPPVRLELDVSDVGMALNAFSEVIISPDGSRFAAVSGENGQLFYRTAEDMEFRPVPGTSDVRSPSFSPDGEWITYEASGNLLRVSLAGGQPTELVRGDSLSVRLVDWGAEGWIVFWAGVRGGGGTALFRVPDTGGRVERLTGEPDWLTQSPRLLPDGSGVIFTSPERGVAVYDIAADSARVLIPEGMDAMYVASGHLLYLDPGGGLWAAPFDPDRKETTGDAKPVLQGVMTTFVLGRYSVSRNGTLVYGAGPSSGGSAATEMLVIGLDGAETVMDLRPRQMSNLRWAPDGRRVVYDGPDAGDLTRNDIYVYDTELENAPRRITNAGNNRAPVFSPDGRKVVFASSRDGTDGFDLFIRDLDSDVQPRHFVSLPGPQYPRDWPADDLIVLESGTTTGILIARLAGDSADVTPYYVPDADVDLPVVSPDGALIAYHSNESGQDEVYIRAFPEPRSEVIVSEGGGRRPIWAPDGTTLYYSSFSGNTIFAAEIQREPTAVVVSRRTVLELVRGFTVLDLHPDGDRFIARRLASEGAGTDPGQGGEGEPIRHIVVHNWFTELRGLFGGGG